MSLGSGGEAIFDGCSGNFGESEGAEDIGGSRYVAGVHSIGDAMNRMVNFYSSPLICPIFV